MLKILTPIFLGFILVTGCSSHSMKERTFRDYMREDDFKAERYKPPTKYEKEEACSLIQNDIGKLQPKINSSDESIRKEAARELKWLRGHARRFDCDIEYETISVTDSKTESKKDSDSSKPDTQKTAVGTGMQESRPALAPAPRDVSPAEVTTLSFDMCFEKCKKLTNRTNEQCFDACLRR